MSLTKTEQEHRLEALNVARFLRTILASALDISPEALSPRIRIQMDPGDLGSERLSRQIVITLDVHEAQKLAHKLNRDPA